MKTRAAGLSIASNSALIALKLVAGVVTGSVSIITEAVHSSVDLVASIIAFVSVRKADVPADQEHRYGHHKIESLAAAIEGMLILAGSAIIVFEAIRRLINGSQVEHLGFGIVVIAFSGCVNFAVSSFLARRARQTESPALEGDAAHLRTDAWTSFGVLGGLILVQITGQTWIDPLVALVVAAAIVAAGLRLLTRSSRVLVDEALPGAEQAVIAEEVVAFGPRGVAGFHNLRTRRAGPRRYVDLHVQFRSGTTLEAAHRTAHELQDAITARLRNADVLIHLEPEDRVRPGTEISPGAGSGSEAARSAPR
jgi:cation diffusion facilitator family transporter